MSKKYYINRYIKNKKAKETYLKKAGYLNKKPFMYRKLLKKSKELGLNIKRIEELNSYRCLLNKKENEYLTIWCSSKFIYNLEWKERKRSSLKMDLKKIDIKNQDNELFSNKKDCYLKSGYSLY